MSWGGGSASFGWLAWHYRTSRTTSLLSELLGQSISVNPLVVSHSNPSSRHPSRRLPRTAHHVATHVDGVGFIVVLLRLARRALLELLGDRRLHLGLHTRPDAIVAAVLHHQPPRAPLVIERDVVLVAKRLHDGVGRLEVLLLAVT